MLDHPYIQFGMSYYLEEEIKSWEKFTKEFKGRKRDLKGSSIFDGEKAEILTHEINKIPESNTKVRFELILRKINSQLEDNFYLYNE